jgi:hypothetical protein
MANRVPACFDLSPTEVNDMLVFVFRPAMVLVFDIFIFPSCTTMLDDDRFEHFLDFDEVRVPHKVLLC